MQQPEHQTSGSFEMPIIGKKIQTTHKKNHKHGIRSFSSLKNHQLNIDLHQDLSNREVNYSSSDG